MQTGLGNLGRVTKKEESEYVGGKKSANKGDREPQSTEIKLHRGLAETR